MEVDAPKDSVTVEETSEKTQELDQEQQSANNKKKKIRPYHRIHAHRNPLSDSPLD